MMGRIRRTQERILLMLKQRGLDDAPDEQQRADDP
jgi:hypothetical protein